MGLIIMMTNSTCKSHDIAHICIYAIVRDALYISPFMIFSVTHYLKLSNAMTRGV